MKKIFLFFIVATLLIVPLFGNAQEARNASGTSVQNEPTRTNFTNVGVMGLNVEGNPGYIVLANSLGYQYTDQAFEYYLWVKSDGDLCIASQGRLKNSSNFPNGDWTEFEKQSVCTVVGGQS